MTLTVALCARDGIIVHATIQEARCINVIAMFLEDIDMPVPMHVPLQGADGEHIVTVLNWLRGERAQVLSAAQVMPAQRLFALMNAVDYLNVPDLLDELCRNLAERIRGRTPEQITQDLCIVDDLDPEDERRVTAHTQHMTAFGSA